MTDLQPEHFRFEGANAGACGIQTLTISADEVKKILTIEEGHFTDVKAIETSPAALTRVIAALSNAEGGELFIGIDEGSGPKKRKWRGVCKSRSCERSRSSV
jgi:hypothetical protein